MAVEMKNTQNNNWITKKLGDSATLKARIGWQGLTTKEYQKFGDYFLVTGTEFKNGLIDWDSCYYVNENRYNQDKYIQLKIGDVIVTKDGTIGKTAYINKLSKPATLNSGVFVIRPINDQFNSKFFYYLLTSNIFKEFLEKLSAGSTINHLYQKDFVNFNFPLPPTLAEQEAIAEALGDTDALIESLETLIAKKRRIKEGVMQELLTPKSDWISVKLESISDPNQKWSFTGGPFGSNLKSSDYKKNGIRIIQLQNIGDGIFYDEYQIFTSTEKADELISCNIYPGEIILSKMGDPVARACIIPDTYARFLMCSDGIRLAVDGKKYNTYFIYTLINSPNFRKKAENTSSGSTRKRIGLSELRELELNLPNSLIEQNRLANILLDIDNEIEYLDEKLSKTRKIKEGMMQELLTGRIRLV